MDELRGARLLAQRYSLYLKQVKENMVLETLVYSHVPELSSLTHLSRNFSSLSFTE